MAKNYSYPRVTMSTLAKKHSHNVVNVPDTTIMFAPLVTEKGPDDRVVKVHTLSEFIEIFGSFNEEFYNLNGQMALNVYNWLSNGGTLMVKRLVGNGTKASLTTAATSGITTVAGHTVHTKPFVNAKIFRKENLLIADITKDEDSSSKFAIINLDSINSSIFQTEIVEDKTELVLDSDGKPVIDTTKIEIEYTGDTSLSPLQYYLKRKNCTGDYYLVEDSNIDDALLTNGNYLKVFNISIGAPSSGTIKLEARYHGEYYSNISLVVEEITSHDKTKYFNFYVNREDEFGRTVSLEKFLQKSKRSYAAALSKSEYIVELENSIGEVLFKEGECPESFDSTNVTVSKDDSGKHTFTFKFTTDGTNASAEYKSTESLVSTFWASEAKNYLANRLETPIDIIFDAGYSETTKKDVLTFVRNDSDEAIRPDIIYIMDARSLKGLRLCGIEDSYAYTDEFWNNNSSRPTNIAIYEQFFSILDSTFTAQQIHVTPTYFLSKLIAYNDLTYGLQYPTAGLRRGILDDALWVNHNPDPEQKETWFQKRVNYVEKSSREYAFMSQRTFDGSSDMNYTALSFLNNERVLERMKKDLETIGRSYLHEFNDAITIANMTTALNKYVANWISNRTLSMGVVEVVQDEVSENALDINLNIRFTNTIEVINVSIVIE